MRKLTSLILCLVLAPFGKADEKSDTLAAAFASLATSYYVQNGAYVDANKAVSQCSDDYATCVKDFGLWVPSTAESDWDTAQIYKDNISKLADDIPSAQKAIDDIFPTLAGYRYDLSQAYMVLSYATSPEDIAAAITNVNYQMYYVDAYASAAQASIDNWLMADVNTIYYWMGKIDYITSQWK